MKILAVLFLVFVLSLASGVRASKQVNHGTEKRHQRHHQHAAHFNGKATVKKTKHGHHGLSKVHQKLYKKFAMMSVPGASLEDASMLQGQVSQPVQQIMVPVSSETQSSTSPTEMVSSYSRTPAQPSQLSQLGSEVAGGQTMQTVTNQGGQPATVQYQGGQQGAEQGAEQATEEVKPRTQENTVVTQADVDRGGTETVDPNAAADSVQSFVQPAFAGKGEILQGYGGSALQAGSDQLKPQGDAISPQEEVKVVNLGDDEKTVNTANTEDRPCGGCPMNAKCVKGQCQIREDDAQAQGLFTGGKGTASNPGSLSDIHNLESQELKTLLKDATSADASVGATAETQPPTASHGLAPALAQTPDQAQGEIQEQEQRQAADQNANLAGQQIDQQTPPTSSQQSTQPPPQMEPRFSGSQVKELRDFARMYKMYQFIRKMEKRINDPDCAPVCRKTCKSFCPAKCCRRHRRHGNATLKASLAQTVASIHGTGAKTKSKKLMDAKLMEDDDDTKEDEEMDEKAGRKHIFVKIAKNNELDKPRRYI